MVAQGLRLQPLTADACLLVADCSLVKKLYNAGYEIADHTQSHISVSCTGPCSVSVQAFWGAAPFRSNGAQPHSACPALCSIPSLSMQLRGLSYAQVEKEISDGRRSLAACGIPASDIVGFRGPLLETDANTRKALSKLGFLYDRHAAVVGHAAALCSLLSRRVPALLARSQQARAPAWHAGTNQAVLGARATLATRLHCRHCSALKAGCLPLPPLRSTLLEETSGNSVSRSPSQRVYPFSMDNGVPLNCKWYGGIQSCSTSERWAGLFEVSFVAGGGVGSLGGEPRSSCWNCLLYEVAALS